MTDDRATGEGGVVPRPKAISMFRFRAGCVALLAVSATSVLTSSAAAHDGSSHAAIGDLCSPFGGVSVATAGAGGQPYALGGQPDHRGALDVATTAETTTAVQKDVRVYVHVLRKSDGSGGIEPERVTAQIEHLNASFGGTTTFTVVDTTYTDNDSWYAMAMGSREERQAKKALRQGTADDLNLYVPGPGDYAWATFPWSYARNPSDDGIVVRTTWITTPGGNEGDTAVHETGHWMGLYHTFQNGCRKEGDYVDDTPPRHPARLAARRGGTRAPAPGSIPPTTS